MPSDDGRIRVAIVGTGLAGLATGHLLHNDKRRRYSVTLFERGERMSLDYASVSLRDESNGEVSRVDLPMRAFAGGYYRNLQALYDYLGIQYRAQRFLFAFSKLAPRSEKPGRSSTPYFIHSSNNHCMPPVRPNGVGVLDHALEALFLLIAYAWLTICCFVVLPGEMETFGAFLKRVWVPEYFASHYIVPLFSSVATCSHDELLDFPARDLLEYKRMTNGADHFVVARGVHGAQAMLSENLAVKLSAEVTRVERHGNGLSLSWRELSAGEQGLRQERFDRVILAVTPDVVARIYPPLEAAMSAVPTITVESRVLERLGLQQRFSVVDHGTKSKARSTRQQRRDAELISLRTSFSKSPQTEALHEVECGAVVATCAAREVAGMRVLHSSSFPRVLRTPRSRMVVNKLFRETSEPASEKDAGWKNGDSGVWLAGGWCWDGMVLLEGCVVSAMRVANAFDVEVPWSVPADSVM